MCTAPKTDTSAQQFAQKEAADARAEEELRQQRIDYGLDSLNAIFDGGQRFKTFEGFQAGDGNLIDSPGLLGLVDDRRQAYLDLQQPRLQGQLEDAQEDLTFNLARAGRLGSTTALNRSADLSDAFQLADADILAQANADAGAFQTDINNTRSSLESTLRATADPSATVNNALSRAVAFRESQPVPSQLGDIFGSVVSGIGQGVSSYEQLQLQNRLNSILAGPNSNQSGRVVG